VSTDALVTLGSTLPIEVPALRAVAHVGGKRTPLSARSDRALMEGERDAARWNRLRILLYSAPSISA